MQSLTLHSYVGMDGILLLKVPFTPKDANLEVTVTIQPITYNLKMAVTFIFINQLFNAISRSPFYE